MSFVFNELVATGLLLGVASSLLLIHIIFNCFIYIDTTHCSLEVQLKESHGRQNKYIYLVHHTFAGNEQHTLISMIHPSHTIRRSDSCHHTILLNIEYPIHIWLLVQNF